MSYCILLFLVFLSASNESVPESKNRSAVLPTKVISIADGDTFSILQNNQTLRIRIDAIDAPEKGMPYSKQSKKYLAALCFHKPVKLKVMKTDRYGRLIARAILPDGRDISAEMIRAGMAWHYKQYSADKTLAHLEILARQKHIGLWQDPHPIAPWEIRKLHRNGISTKGYFNTATPSALN
jgi:micrococcal nuclease